MREFLEIADIDSFMKVAESANLIIRIDPYILVNVYGLIFYVDLGKLDKRDVRRIFQGLRDKLIIVRKTEVKKSIYEFLKGEARQAEH